MSQSNDLFATIAAGDDTREDAIRGLMHIGSLLPQSPLQREKKASSEAQLLHKPWPG